MLLSSNIRTKHAKQPGSLFLNKLPDLSRRKKYGASSMFVG